MIGLEMNFPKLIVFSHLTSSRNNPATLLIRGGNISHQREFELYWN